jgi:GNAT superfamily N-acetyltransferase
MRAADSCHHHPVVVVDAALVERVESFAAESSASLARSRAELEPMSGATAVSRAGGSVVFVGPGMYVNRAIGMGVRESARPDDVDFVVDFYRERDLTPEIELCPYADPAIRSRAGELGFTLEWFRNVYVRTANDPPSAAGAAHVQFVSVDERSYGDWEALCMSVFDGVPDIGNRFLAARHHMAGEHDWVVRLDDDPVAVCSLLITAGTAELGGMGVLPTARARGVQRACLAHRIAIARDAGCDLLLTTATPGGSSARNIERAGFRCLYTQVGLVQRTS